MKYTAEELRRHLVNAKEICAVLSESLAENPQDAGISICLESAQSEVQETLLKLKYAEREVRNEALVVNQDEFSHAEKALYGALT